jgi:hypothetical protein
MKKLWKLSGGLALTLTLSSMAIAQDTTTKTTTTTTATKTEVVQNADGTYTVIEYPVGKEVTVSLTPYNLQGATGSARVLRAADGTKIYLDLANVTGDAKSYYAYAIDPKGTPTLLGPVMIENGVAKAEFATPMNQFMIVLSPTEGVTAFNSDVPVTFRSSVPTGYAVVPTAITSTTSNNKQVATSTEVASAYDVPLLGVPSFSKTAEIRINFSGDLAGLKGKAYVDPTKNGTTKVKMRFDDMNKVPAGKRFVLWASSPDGKYTKLGQVINGGGEREESEIRSETAMKDFGLFVTVEDAEVVQPTSKIYSVFSVNP